MSNITVNKFPSKKECIGYKPFQKSFESKFDGTSIYAKAVQDIYTYACKCGCGQGYEMIIDLTKS